MESWIEWDFNEVEAEDEREAEADNEERGRRDGGKDEVSRDDVDKEVRAVDDEVVAVDVCVCVSIVAAAVVAGKVGTDAGAGGNSCGCGGGGGGGGGGSGGGGGDVDDDEDDEDDDDDDDRIEEGIASDDGGGTESETKVTGSGWDAESGGERVNLGKSCLDWVVEKVEAIVREDEGKVGDERRLEGDEGKSKANEDEDCVWRVEDERGSDVEDLGLGDLLIPWLTILVDSVFVLIKFCLNGGEDEAVGWCDKEDVRLRVAFVELPFKRESGDLVVLVDLSYSLDDVFSNLTIGGSGLSGLNIGGGCLGLSSRIELKVPL